MFADQILQEQGNTTAKESLYDPAAMDTSHSKPQRKNSTVLGIILTGQETSKFTCAITTKMNFWSSGWSYVILCLPKVVLNPGY